VVRDLTNPTKPDIVLKTATNQSVGSLAANGSKTFTVAVSRSAGLPADNYQILANIIPVQTVTESSTADNWVASPTKTNNGAPGGTRTHNLRLRRPLLYPVELQALGTGRATMTIASRHSGGQA
jgi:hypothetical protein